MKLYVLKVGSYDDSYSAMTAEDNGEISNIWNNTGSVTSHKIIYYMDYDVEQVRCECTIDIYDMKNMDKDEMKRLLQKQMFNLLDYDDTKHVNYYIRFSDEWNPEIERDPFNKTYYKTYANDYI
jgi:hypothetical protein